MNDGGGRTAKLGFAASVWVWVHGCALWSEQGDSAAKHGEGRSKQRENKGGNFFIVLTILPL
jgi:hypothetical protein